MDQVPYICADSENFVREDLTFFFDKGKGDPNSTKAAIISPPGKRHLNGVCWRADDGPRSNAGLAALIFRGSRPVLLRNSIIL